MLFGLALVAQPTAERLLELQGLRDRGRVTEEECAAARRRILDGV